MSKDKATVTVQADDLSDAHQKSDNALKRYFRHGYNIVATSAEATANDTGFVTRWTVHITAEAVR